MQEERTYFMGIDLHKKYATFTVLDEDGSEIDQRNILNDAEDFTLYLRQWKGKIKVALEATYNWYWLVDLLQRLGTEVKLAHPYKTRIIGEAKIKTDKIDSRILAQLLRADFLPTAYLADASTRDQREWLRHRTYLVRIQTSLKNRIHCLIDKHNTRHNFSDLFGKKGLEFLQGLILPEKTKQCLDSLLSMFGHIHGEIEQITKQIRISAQEDQQACLLESIPGVGYYSALLMLKEIGAVDRFASAKKLVAFSGLAPGISSSGGKSFTRGITKQGNSYLRWISLQAASSVIRTKSDQRLMRLYGRIQHRRNSKIAKVAVAKEILTFVYFILKNQEPYDPNRLNSNRRAILPGD